MRELVLWAVLSTLLIIGCRRHPVVQSNEIEVYERFWEEARTEVTARARIELGCDAVHAEMVAKQGRYPTEVSVHGCGRSALYHRALRRHFGKYTTKNTTWQAVAVSPVIAGAVPNAPAQQLDDEVPPPPE